MDSITHSLLGAALAKTRLGRVSPFAPAALVIGANLPDFENLVLAFCDKPTNMIHHRSVTHSLLGVVVLAPLFALLVRWLEIRLVKNRPRGPFWMLFGGVSLAVASHPLLDWLNTYGVRFWLPFDATWHHGDLVFIIDPWIWLILGGAVCLAGKRTIAGTIALATLGGLLTAIVLVAGWFTPWALQIIWPAAIVLFVVGRWRGFGRRHANELVVAALALAVVYVGFLGWAGRRAWEMSQPVIAERLGPGERVIAHTLSPQPANPLRWQIIAETGQALYRHTFSITEQPGGVVRLRKGLDDPLVRRVASGREGEAWRVFSRHPVALVANWRGGRRVYLLDGRYYSLPPRGFSSLVIDTSPTAAARVGSFGVR